MSDVTVGVGIDATAATLTLFDVMAKTDEATAKLAAVRRKALSVIGQVNSMVAQGYSSLKQLIVRAGGMIDPFFDMCFTMISTLISTAVSGALLMMSTMNPVLIAAGLSLMVVATELSIKTNMELAEARAKADEFLARTQNRTEHPTQPGVVTSGHTFFNPRRF